MNAFVPAVVLLAMSLVARSEAESVMSTVPLQSRVTRVQPMTGIVFWDDSEHTKTDAIQLEYSYVGYSDIVTAADTYDWAAVDRKLAEIAGRGHQAILRFHFVYPGRSTTVPAHIKALPDYKETVGKSEKQDTGFPDWSHPEMKRFVMEFYSRFAARYDKDPRIAFLQTGFGLWAEYHIYDGPFELGVTFPDKAFQAEFLHHLAATFKTLPWNVSVDAANGDVSPLAGNEDLLKLSFGVFDDSFLCKQHPKENEPNWNALDRKRYLRAPAGGEFSYYNERDQKLALSAKGPNGVPFEKAAAAFHISYMIGNDQPDHQPMDRIRQAGMACGYRFRVDSFLTGEGASRIGITNTGVAPIYQDAYPAVNGVRAERSLKGLASGASAVFDIAAGGKEPRLTIECDRLVPGQAIGFDADLK